MRTAGRKYKLTHVPLLLLPLLLLLPSLLLLLSSGSVPSWMRTLSCRQEVQADTCAAAAAAAAAAAVIRFSAIMDEDFELQGKKYVIAEYPHGEATC
jgi:hypothetical protein